MNAEVISSRYAKALLSYAMENGAEDRVYSQVETILQAMQDMPQLGEYILKHDDISLSKKKELLATALSEPVSEELEKFLHLVSDHRRMELLQVMLWAFVSRYREAKGIKIGSLVTAVPAEGLRDRLESMLSAGDSAKVHFRTEVDPELIGGFVFELDGCRLDASVRTKLKKISDELIDTASRIV